MTDNEIIQALHCCNNGWCDRCPYHGREDVAACSEQSGADILDLIIRQQAEIERLKGWGLLLKAESHAPIIKKARQSAITEFAEKFKEAVIYIPWCEYPPIHREIDNLVKEMVGETE